MSPERNALSRRQLGAVGIGMAASATGSARAQQSSEIENSSQTSEPVMDDPRSKYPKPPFEQQTQPWPGLARNMDPKPDHGETSYRGSGRPAGRKALITGGDSGMGRAAAIAYATGRCRRRHQLFPDGGTGCPRGSRTDQGRGSERLSRSRGICVTKHSANDW